MKKFSLLLTCVFMMILFCGCTSSARAETDTDNTQSTAPEVTVIMPENNFTKENNEPQISEESENITYPAGNYYANKNSKKFHKADCKSVKLIKEENLYITSSREELINSGYSPCKNCNP